MSASPYEERPQSFSRNILGKSSFPKKALSNIFLCRSLKKKQIKKKQTKKKFNIDKSTNIKKYMSFVLQLKILILFYLFNSPL